MSTPSARSQFLKAVSKKKEPEPIREMADSGTGEGNIQGKLEVFYSAGK